MPIEDFEENRKNEVDEERRGQLDLFMSQVAVDNNYEIISTQKCRYDHKFATYSDFGEITGEKIKIVENNIAVIDIDINYEDIDNYLDMKYADTIIYEIEDKLIDIASNENAIIVKTASDSYHIYCNGESIKSDPLLANKKSSYIKAFEYKKTYECDDGSTMDIKLFDIDLFVPTRFGSNCGVMLPGSRVINKKGDYSCYTIIHGKDNVDEKMSSIYYIWDDLKDFFGIGDLDSIWVEEKEPRSPYRTKKLNDSELVKNGMSKKMFDLTIKGFKDVEIHHWAAPIEKEITLYPLICGLNACVNNEIDELDVEEAIDYIKKNAKLTLNAELNFDRIMFSTDDISSTPFSLLKMLRIHNSEYYKNNLSPLVAKMLSTSNGTTDDENYGDIIMTLELLRTIISGFYKKDIYADFELTDNEMTISPLLSAIYSCESEYISKSDIKDLQLKIITKCNLSNAAMRQIREIDGEINASKDPSYLIDMLRIHNPPFYHDSIETLMSRERGGIDLNDPFTIEQMEDINYFKNGNIMWSLLFDDISRGLVFISSDDCIYVKVFRAWNNSYKLIKCSDEQLKSRLSKIIIKSPDIESDIFVRLDKLIYSEKYSKITSRYKSVYKKRGVCFHSTSDKDLSLFTGFTFPERDTVDIGKICLFLDHIKNIISNGNEILYKYILSWIAFIVQNPGKKTETCLMILGDEGTGKTMFTTVICKLFGNYSLSNIASIDDVVGQFNAITENKILVVLNELSAAENTANKKSIHNKLKTLITDNINVLNRKGIDQYESENVSNYMICSNEFNPLIISENDRRYVVTEVDNSKRGNTTYFSKLFNSFDEEFYINLYNYFRLYNIKNFNLKHIPMTNKRRSMMNMGLDSLTFYIKQNLNKYKTPQFTASQAYVDYVDFYRNERNVFIHNQKVFYEKMSSMCNIKQKRLNGSSVCSKLYVLKEELLKKFEDECVFECEIEDEPAED